MPTMARAREDIEAQLQQAILRSGMTRYRLAQLSGVSEAVLSRFVAGKRTVTLTTAARLAGVLGLELKPGMKAASRTRKDK